MARWKQAFWVVLAIPTFYMPAAYLVVIVRGLGAMFSLWSIDVSALEQHLLAAALVVTACMWCVYIPWALFSGALTWKEKVGWVLWLFLLNMFAMPWFYIWIRRRYSGRDREIPARHIAAAERHLKSLSVPREVLTEGQWRAVVKSVRARRTSRWIGVSLLGLSLFYSGCVFMLYRMVSGQTLYFALPELTIIDSSTDTVMYESTPDLELVRKAGLVPLYVGMMLGSKMAFGVYLFVLGVLNLMPRPEATLFDQLLRGLAPTEAKPGQPPS